MSMSNLLSSVKVAFKFKFQESFLAIVSLKFNDEIIIRFCRIIVRGDNTLWFQPPALKNANWANCFLIDPKETWKEFHDYVIAIFLKELNKKVDEGEFPKEKFDAITEAFLNPKPKEEIDLDDLPF